MTFTEIPRLPVLLTFLIVLSGCATRTMIPTPSLYTNTARPLFGDLAPELAGDRLQVLYVTDRLPEQDSPGTTIGYGSKRSAPSIGNPVNSRYFIFSSRQRLGTLVPSELTAAQREFMRRSTNLDVIVYQGSGGGLFRHGYYNDPAVSSDILMVLRYGWRPGEGERQGLERLDANTWRISEAYWKPQE